MCTASFLPKVKRPGRGVDHPHPSSVEVKERVQLYLYSPLGLRGLFLVELYLLHISTIPHGVIFQKTATFAVTVIRT
jgi:hypothetical protein